MSEEGTDLINNQDSGNLYSENSEDFIPGNFDDSTIQTKITTRFSQRTKLEIVRDMSIVSSLYFQGYKAKEIIREWKIRTGAKYKLSEGGIYHIISTAQSIWQKKTFKNINELKAKELAKLDALESEYWRAWHKSLLKSKQTTKKSERGVLPTGNMIVDENGNLVPEERTVFIETELQEREIERDGNPEFLRGVERCIEQRSKILGLYNPIQFLSDGSLLDHGNEQYQFGLPEIYQRFMAVIQIQSNYSKE